MPCVMVTHPLIDDPLTPTVNVDGFAPDKEHIVLSSVHCHFGTIGLNPECVPPILFITRVHSNQFCNLFATLSPPSCLLLFLPFGQISDAGTLQL